MSKTQSIKQTGFSLIELLVTMAIIATLSVIVIAGFRAGQNQRSVSLGVDFLTTALRDTQEAALSGKRICPNGSAPINFRLDVSANSTSVSLYGECGPDVLITSYSFPQNTKIAAVNSIIISNAAYPSGSSVTSVKLRMQTPFAVATASIPADTAFKPFKNLQIFISTSDGSYSKSVTVDGLSGRVGINQVNSTGL
jgi:prepilin-type N-terminal cleavage/methylation domain-containing protein